MILIDAGHGGMAAGAKNEFCSEKDLNLIYALILKQRLDAFGLSSMLLRQDDITMCLKDRLTVFEEDESFKLLLSIHCNSFKDPIAHGMELFCNESGVRMAQYIADELRYHKKFSWRGIKKPEKIYIIKNAKKPALLLELGFMSNPEDFQNLVNPKVQFQLINKIVYGLIRGKNEGAYSR